MRKKEIIKQVFFLFFIPLILKASYPLKLSKNFYWIKNKILKYKIVTYYVNYFKILSKKQYFQKNCQYNKHYIDNIPRVLQSYIN